MSQSTIQELAQKKKEINQMISSLNQSINSAFSKIKYYQQPMPNSKTVRGYMEKERSKWLPIWQGRLKSYRDQLSIQNELLKGVNNLIEKIKNPTAPDLINKVLEAKI